jgi:hypothetical protein
MRNRFKLILALALAAPALAAPLAVTSAAAGDVKRFMAPCGSGQLCPWFEADITAPAGFKRDGEFGQNNRIVAFFPDKAKLGPEDPLIYVRTSQNGDGRSLDIQASNSNAQWKTMVPDSKVERLADIPRAEGKQAWQVFRYRNPSRPRQAHEMLAFGTHTESNGQRFFYMVTLSAANEAALNKGMPGWRQVLGVL